MVNQNGLKCPKCNHVIDINDALYKKIELEIEIKHQKEIETKRIEYKNALSELDKKASLLEQQKAEFNQRINDEVNQKLKLEQNKLSIELKKKFDLEYSEEKAILEKELREKSEQVRELNKSRAEIERLKREKDETESRIRAETEKALNQKLQEEREKINKSADDRNEMRLREKDIQLKQIQEQLIIAQKKAEQGSMQLQGEAQELAIEEWLKANFPFDFIKEVKKGQYGADCIQEIHTRDSKACCKIVFESKRTKEFNNDWINKLKTDMQNSKADIGIIVTEVMPKDMPKAGLKNGIWICSFEEFKILTPVLRESLISIDKINKSNENKSDKVNLLYNFLTSNELNQYVESIIEGFTIMKTELNKEKEYIQKSWAKREKQIENIQNSAIKIIGSIEGIAGDKFKIQSLEHKYLD